MRNLVAPFIALALFSSACSTPNQTLTAQVAVMLATDRVVKDRPDRAAKAVAIADDVLKLAGSDTASTVSALMLVVRAKIDWNELTAVEVMSVNLLLAAIETELNNRINVGQIPADQVYKVALVASWVKLAAQPYVPTPSA